MDVGRMQWWFNYPVLRKGMFVGAEDHGPPAVTMPKALP